MVKNALIYARKSRGTEGSSVEEDLEKQRETLINIAKNKNYKILDIYQEVAMSVDEEREQFNKMISRIKTGQIHVVLISAIDRTARSLGIFEKFLQACKDYDVVIETPREEIDLKNAGSELLALIQAVLAKSEYGLTKRRFAEGKVQAVSIKKRWVGSTAPFGYIYDKNTKGLIVDEERKHIYRMMVDLALEGFSFGQIAEKLNEKGYRTRKGNMWTTVRIHRILRRRTYLGEAEYNSTIIKQRGYSQDCHEPLITYEEFNKIQQLADARRRYGIEDRRTWGKVKTILDDLIYCGKCHRKYTIQLTNATASRPNRKPFYSVRGCIHKDDRTGEKCINGGCKISYLEEYLFEYLKKYRNKINKKLTQIENSDSTEVIDKMLEKEKSLIKDIKNINDEMDRLNRAYLAKVMTLEELSKFKEELSNNKINLQMELDSLQKQIESMDTERVVEVLEEQVDAIDDILNNKEVSIEDKNALLKTIIKRIEIIKEKNTYGKPSKINIYLHEII